MKQGAKITLVTLIIVIAVGIAGACYSYYSSRALVSTTFPPAILQSSSLATERFTHWHVSFSAHDISHTACVNLSGRVWYGAALTEAWLETHSNEEAANRESSIRQQCVFTLGSDFNVVHRPTR